MDKTVVFVDDGFFRLVKKYLQEASNEKLQFLQTFRNICKNEDLSLGHLFVYMAPPYQSRTPSKQENIIRCQYDKMKKMLCGKKWTTLREGRCQRLKINGNFEYSQKGVDTHLVMDLVKMPVVFPNVKKIILIASDSDFIPAIKDLQDQNIEVILYTFFDKTRGSKFSTSNYLLKSVDRFVELKKEFFKKNG